MGKTIKYSVIIPIFNGEKTIDRCLSSLLIQERPAGYARDTVVLFSSCVSLLFKNIPV